MITLNHFDFPQALEDIGGWSNRETITAFKNYAKTVFKAYGNQVNIG
ncbi:beta glucosidase [Tetragenococcus muriaticus 3MR10-3]|uniref:Beta glucosidase n=1 Tax=Tetragenococcus muriaticus 3MR10-3 TaxID=1302648 RepID=A0A091C5Y1_9ENTE|nr:beta glucosidase [Tetragenococcus muriaticus 3MR10-3]